MATMSKMSMVMSLSALGHGMTQGMSNISVRPLMPCTKLQGVENRGLYLEVCKVCQALSEEDRHKECKNHSGQTQFSRKGNPTTDPSFKNALMQVKKDGKPYKVHGCDQLMPGEVRQMGAY
jgi:hypothetical protein